MKIRSLCLGLGMLLVLATTATGKDVPPPHSGGNPDRGMFIFNTYCSACHGDEGKGDGPMAPRLGRDFQAVPTDLSNPAWQKSRDDKALKKIIRDGGKAAHRSQFMPAWGAGLSGGAFNLGRRASLASRSSRPSRRPPRQSPRILARPHGMDARTPSPQNRS